MSEYRYYQDRSVLVTGGAGFIGSHLVRGLLAAGAKVRVLDNFSHGKKANLTEVETHLDLRVGDITDLPTCREAVQGCAVVFHLAALGSVPRSVEEPILYNQVNIGGTLNILEACREQKVKRVVYSASSSAYGDVSADPSSPPPPHPISPLPKVETMTPAPKSPYAITKLVGEYYVRNYAEVFQLEGISLRYFNVFGPRQDPKGQYAAVIPAWISALLNGQNPKIYGDGEQSRDFCYVDNVVHANLLAGSIEKKLDGPTVNIACGQATSLNSLLKNLQVLTNKTVTAHYLPPRAGDIKDSLANISAANTILGYEPKILFDKGLEKTASWFSQAHFPT